MPLRSFALRNKSSLWILPALGLELRKGPPLPLGCALGVWNIPSLHHRVYPLHVHQPSVHDPIVYLLYPVYPL